MNPGGEKVSTALRGSLRLRLLLGTLLWIAATILVAGWALGGLFRQHVSAQLHAELGTHLDQLAAHLAIDSDGRLFLSVAQSDPRFGKPLSGLYWQIDRVGGVSGVDGDTRGLLRSRSLWDDVLKLPVDSPADGEIHRHRIAGPEKTTVELVERVVHLEDFPDRFRLAVAADEKRMAEPVERFNGMLWLALGLLGAGLGLVAVIQVWIALAPLRRLHGALAAVRNGESHQLCGSFPQEVQPLVDEFNTVLAQNAEVIERARTQAGNLAHALKTPLSVIANEVEGKGDDLALLVSGQVDVARRQIDYHLRRSRAAASVRVPGARTPVRPVIDGLLRVMQRIHVERDLELIVHPVGGNVVFRGEEQDLQEMLGNLVDNACKWARRRVEITLAKTSHELSITLDDDGAGIAETERERMLGRGERADEQTPGSGLGLSIVNELARLYGGRVELADSPLGGLRARLVLPAVENTL